MYLIGPIPIFDAQKCASKVVLQFSEITTPLIYSCGQTNPLRTTQSPAKTQHHPSTAIIKFQLNVAHQHDVIYRTLKIRHCNPNMCKSVRACV